MSIFTWWQSKANQTADMSPKEECNITKTQAITIVNNLSEVKRYFQNSSPSSEGQISTPKITADEVSSSSIRVHVYSIEEYPNDPEIIGHTATFNWYKVDRCTGKIKCFFTRYDENGEPIRGSEQNEYPCE